MKNFAKGIFFNEILFEIIYLKENTDVKLYEPVTLKKAYAKTMSLLQDKVIYPVSYRKLVFTKFKTKLRGIIIGQTTRSEGKYIPGHSYPPDDYEQASLKIYKKYAFWVVAVGMNKTVLVPKDSTVLILDI
jgi:hypothetical protein